MPDNLEPMYTVEHLAAHWHVQSETVRRWIRAKKLRAIQPQGRLYLIPQSAVTEFERTWTVTDEDEPLLHAAGE